MLLSRLAIGALRVGDFTATQLEEMRQSLSQVAGHSATGQGRHHDQQFATRLGTGIANDHPRMQRS